jgi:ABC-type multidrug transport system ATPase subunit
MPQNSPKITLEAANLRKDFDRRPVFKNLNFTLTNSDSLAITGKNGSGKSTLIKVLANTYSQTSGNVSFSIEGKPVERQHFYKYIGFVSPYLNLYDEFTGYENLHFVTNLRGLNKELIDDVLKRVGLFERRHDLVKIYSSGMKQRLKLAFSIIHNPLILMLDEPTSNLDAEGIAAVNSIAEEYKHGRILIIATNDEHERSLCKSDINLSKQTLAGSNNNV